ncbi:hypothetical protein GCM10019059_23910 [Camelimonas fluminis]|nr:hypothetical protein GCM10019059_23910 [Camelimonas fluminis]
MQTARRSIPEKNVTRASRRQCLLFRRCSILRELAPPKTRRVTPAVATRGFMGVPPFQPADAGAFPAKAMGRIQRTQLPWTHSGQRPPPAGASESAAKCQIVA